MFYKLSVPPTAEQGSYTAIVSNRFTTKAADALFTYNSARDHDGLPPLTRMPRGTQYTPLYVWEVQQYTGTQYGWETVTQADTRKEALQNLKEYRENQPEYPARLHRRPITREEIAGHTV